MAIEETGRSRAAKYARAAAFFLRPPDEDPLPDTETQSLYSAGNDVGQPPGRTEPGALTPPAALDGTETPGSSNFSFGLPVVALPGRGLGVSLALAYNSRVWHKSADGLGQTHMTYDVDSGWPAPGFQIGYGHLEAQGSAGFTLTSPGGTRHQLTFVGGNTYESIDGSFIRFVGGQGGGTVIYPDGTRVEYGAAGADGFRSFPVRITDHNGNYLLVSYVDPDGAGSQPQAGPKIAAVQDTLGRYVRFHYQGNDLVTITVPGYAGGADRQVVRFYYEDMTVNQAGSFALASDKVHAPATARVLRYVYLPGTRVGYRYDYSSYGMIFRASELRGMTVATTATDQIGSVTSEGQWAAETEYDYPRTPASLTDAPRFTSRNDPWAGQTSARPVYNFSADQSQGLTVVTSPDGTRAETYTIVHPTFWDDGLVRETIVKRSDGTVLARAVVTWEHDGNLRNPRPQRVDATNEAGQTRSVVYTYTTYNNVSTMSERGFDGAELRRTETIYETRTEWVGRRLLRLPTSIRVFAGGSGTPAARTDFVYANGGGGLVSCPGIVMHDPAYYPGAAGYDPATDYRGNVVSVTRYADAAAGAGAVTDTFTYDVAGNARTATADCCRQREFIYGDFHYYAYLRIEKRGDAGQLSTEYMADFNTGLPREVTDENSQKTFVHYYPETLRHFRTERPDGGYTQSEYGDNLYADPDAAHMHSYAKTITALDTGRAVESWQFFDGRGAVARTFVQTGAHGTTGAYVIADLEYDFMGRGYRASNPYYGAEGGTAVNPPGLWTTSRFDALGRVDQVTLPDGNVARATYAGSVTTTVDPADKARRQIADALGRLARLDEPDAGGNLGTTETPAQATSYQYDALDNLVKITQGSQARFFRYDALGRMTHERHPEQDAPHSQPDALTGNAEWSSRRVYNSHGLVADAYDARNVNTHFTYDGLNRPLQVTHTDGTPTVTYEYDEPRAGYFNRGRATAVSTAATASAPSTVQAYDYDLMGRVSRYRQVVGPTTYTVGYTYNLAGQVVTQSYPSGRVVTNGFDQAGRLTGVADAGRSYATGITYAAHGGLLQETWGNGASHSLSYNARLQVSQISLAAGGAERQRYDYEYGRADLTTGAVDQTQNVGQVGRVEGFVDGVKQWRQLFGYDSVGRLTTADEYRGDSPTVRSWRARYDYDRYGNRYQSANPTQDPNLTVGVGYVPVSGVDVAASRNRFEPSITGVQYDAAGQITSDPKFRGMQYQYDANGRQKRAARTDGTGVSTSVYDASGQRVQTSAYGLTRRLVYDAAGRMVAEYEDGLWRRDHVYRGGELLASDEAAPVCYKSVEQFVRDFYQGALARQPGAGELAQWVGRLTQAHGQGRGKARLLSGPSATRY